MSLKTVNNSVKTSQSAMSEQDLLAKDHISPEDVLSLNKITDTYLCSPDANQFGIGKFILIYSDPNLNFPFLKDFNLRVQNINF